MKRTALLAPSFVIALVLAACGEVATDPADPFPPRPYTIDVTRVEPCSGLDAEQRERLSLQHGSESLAQGGTSRACTWPSTDGVGYTFQTLELDAGAAIGADPTSTLVTVAGFGAVQSSPPAQGTGLPFCQVVLDVADDASLRAQLQVSPLAAEADRRTVEATCEQLHTVAAQMLENLRVQQGQ
ncbi:Protein of unknown function [Pseudonocardia ammonioxydans]|uniref:DUF3558 domain-containing protein n=1 Tax=Pseudonocardia ammonioxydans TaxID=260086 RepID=A0A1I4UGY2_PSUAM|nr:DUF3558 family protein [Pseudonocardia ammonioxydans]SFM88101.1 Protein of unknown function [Pseudonocardia ammonioxydans]